MLPKEGGASSPRSRGWPLPELREAAGHLLLPALARLHHTHPDSVGRVGLLARPAGLLSFAAADDTVLAAPVQLSGAESTREVNETLRAVTGGMHAHFTGPGVALEVTFGR
ncbi:hypothetical protein ACVW0K_000019 [Streptomyces filamentosus]